MTGEYPLSIPQAGNIPPGKVLVHNNVQPAGRQGTGGFRYWLQPADDERLTVCDCGWAPESGEHYRMRPADEDAD
jgi:hypothetical protein